MTDSRSTSDSVEVPGRRLGRVRLAGAVAATLSLIAVSAVGGDLLGRGLFDRYQRVWPADLPTSVAQVVLIDPESLKAAGPWPWSRYLLARLTEEIASRGAVAIGFDMPFPEPDRFNPDRIVSLYPELPAGARTALAALPSQDSVFAEVIGRHPVVLARLGIARDAVDFAAGATADPANLPVNASFSRPLPASVQTFPGALTTIADLDEVAAGQALVNGAPDRDGVVRRVPLVASVAGGATPGLALELARVGSGADRLDPIVAGGRLRAIGLGRHVLPVDPDGRMRLHFGRLPDGAVTSAALLLQRGYKPDAFRHKIVLIGLGAAGTSDVVTTPIDREVYGTFIQAQAVDAILAGKALSRPFWARAAEALLAIALALAALLLLPRLRGGAAVLVPIALVAVVLGVSAVAFRLGSLLIDPVGPLLVGSATGAAVLATMFAETALHRRRLRDALDQERVAAARAAGELEAAREIQLGMLPPRDGLAALDPRLDIDALLEPARSVGGDFYDVIRLDADRICFLVGDVTGKGLPAALFMALSRALSKSTILREGNDLARAVIAINAELSRDNAQDMFVTMLIGIVDLTTGEVQLCSAGHENPLRVRTDGSVDPLALDGGPPLCVAEAFPYASEHILLHRGEGLVVVSDGVTEAQNVAGDFFGQDRAIPCLRGWSRDDTARDVSDRLIGEVRRFEAGVDPSDDVTIVSLRYLGPA